MRKGQNGAYRESYNAQASVEAEGSQLIVSAHISKCAADMPELETGITNIPEELGQPERVLADSGYVDREAFKTNPEARHRTVCKRAKRSCTPALPERFCLDLRTELMGG